VTDLAVVGMDPRFGGGARAQMEAFWRAAVALGREPELFYFAHPTLAGRPLEPPLAAPGRRARFRRFDAGNHLAAGPGLAPEVRRARSIWVVATLAPYGYPAVRSGRPYACWLGTGLRDEWAGRRAGLARSRRLALRVNAPVLRSLERRVLRDAARVYATSAYSRDSLAAAGGLHGSRVGILPLPVDLDAFAPVPDEQWRAVLEHPVLVFVGRADDPRKNAGLLLDALPLLRQRIPGARVRLVGSTPSGPLPEGVEATGVVASVPEHVRDASLFVLPSRQEGFGIVAAEALASGVPVLTTPCGGPEELVRASGGGVVLDGFTPEELAGAAGELLEAPARLLAMRASGREYVAREHSPDRLRVRLAEAFRELGEG
jgi:glycosyltransferase involved in cell wall biosynthesis